MELHYWFILVIGTDVCSHSRWPETNLFVLCIAAVKLCGVDRRAGGSLLLVPTYDCAVYVLAARCGTVLRRLATADAVQHRHSAH